jgi:hypothetical protein
MKFDHELLGLGKACKSEHWVGLKHFILLNFSSISLNVGSRITHPYHYYNSFLCKCVSEKDVSGLGQRLWAVYEPKLCFVLIKTGCFIVHNSVICRVLMEQLSVVAIYAHGNFCIICLFISCCCESYC